MTSNLLTLGGEVFIIRDGIESFLGYIDRVEKDAVYVSTMKGESLVKKQDLTRINTPTGKLKYMIQL